MSFTYLWLPLGTTKPSVQDFTPLLSRIEGRFSGINRFLSYHGRLILVISVFFALPALCRYYLHRSSNRLIDIESTVFGVHEYKQEGYLFSRLETSCRPEEEGGLGIIDQKTENTTLLLKHLDKFYNNVDLPWMNLTWSKLYGNTQTPPHVMSLVGSFWWKDVLKLFEKFKSFSVYIPNKGNSMLLWGDNWSGSILKNSMPQLFSFTRKPKCSINFLLQHQEI